LIDKAVEEIQVSNNSSILLGDNIYSVQISSTTNLSLTDAINTALLNKLSIIDADSCYETLKAYYNLNTTSYLLISKSDINSYVKLDNVDRPLLSNSAEINIYHPITRQELNLSLCQNNQFVIKTPIKSAELLNLTQYRDLKSAGIEGYNPNDTSFINICFTHIDNDTQYDTTLTFRGQNYFQNKSAGCSGTNCTYQEVDINNYVTCNCSNIHSSEPIHNEFVDYVLGPFTTWNFEVIYCYAQIFQVNIF
jgi:hypothetical protein